MLGVSTSPWGDDAFIWGQYSRAGGATARKGGVCTVDIDDPAATQRRMIVDPQTWQFSIGSVAAHPWVSDLVAVAPDLDTVAWALCHLDGDGDCPDAPRPLLLERTSTGWTTSQLGTMPPSLAGDALAWTELGSTTMLPTLVYGTAGSGTWLGALSWD